MQLKEIVGIVTGGAVGFGRAFAERILGGGGKVLITDVNASLLETTGQELAAKFGKTNVCWTQQNVVEMDSFHRVFDYATKFFEKPVNLLINNAGIAGDLAFWDDDAPRNWEDVITIDLTAVVRGSQVAIQQFRKNLRGQEGVVINLSSAAGLNPVPYSPQYAAAKAGVVGFTRSCHPLKKQHNIRVVALCPGFAKTAMGKHAEEFLPEWTKLMGGLIEVSKVVDAFEMSLKDPNNSGRCVRIVQSGITYNRFPGDKQLYPDSKL
ncbi:hypothetical protein Poli38472_008985 [Pythium oligandrum]|uniref:15-hydroxyprostaglandin dehydrogenase n=1 Tax=Pythium oligandrum TaxID=41045 RepID=A0A8K1CKU9_PYTOL|nr:hypothetical protein Poli38472_008985 [Pythium oligandrum]|eukprot:TMW64818.1 hypothetical protein Poli38472_008985 [Pythium oligandrum]